MDFQTLNLLFKCSREFGHKPIRDCGLTETECLICSYLYAHPDCSQDELVQGLRMDKTTAAKALRALEDEGLVARRADENDRRRKMLTVTKLGIDRSAAVVDLHDQWLGRVLSVLSEDEQTQFENYCVRLLRAAEALLQNQEN